MNVHPLRLLANSTRAGYALAAFGFFAGASTGCASDNSTQDTVDHGGLAGGSGAAGAGVTSGGNNGGTSNIECPPGIPIRSSSVGGGNSMPVFANGTGVGTLGTSCTSTADCAAGTFCFRSQCTAICGDTIQVAGEVNALADCASQFANAVCVSALSAANIVQSVLACAQVCSTNADCPSGVGCFQGRSYRPMASDPSNYEWYDVAMVCNANP